MPFTEKPPPLPPPNQPLIDPKTGYMDGAWRDWFAKLVAYLARLGAAIP